MLFRLKSNKANSWINYEVIEYRIPTFFCREVIFKNNFLF